jgi:hypothetical protein
MTGQRLALMLVAVLTALPRVSLAQRAPSLALPVDCDIGAGCIVQNYVDHDSGRGARDYRCGNLSYDGHKGTDFRVVDVEAFRRGVAVLAAAPGRVRAVRDGMRDASVRGGKAGVAGREAGNSVVIEHGDGWETQYAHMRRGSVAVRAGDRVEAGTKLGVVGLSGNTEFPHVHLEVRYRGTAIDPFARTRVGEPCERSAGTLWGWDAGKSLAYVATGVLSAGIFGAPPTVEAGSVVADAAFGPDSGAAVFWVQVYGARAGDVEELKLFAPDGSVAASRRGRVERNHAQRLAYVGKRRGDSDWPAGTWRGEFAVYRGGGDAKVVSLEREITLGADRRAAAH